MRRGDDPHERTRILTSAWGSAADPIQCGPCAPLPRREKRGERGGGRGMGPQRAQETVVVGKNGWLVRPYRNRELATDQERLAEAAGNGGSAGGQGGAVACQTCTMTAATSAGARPSPCVNHLGVRLQARRARTVKPPCTAYLQWGTRPRPPKPARAGQSASRCPSSCTPLRHRLGAL